MASTHSSLQFVGTTQRRGRGRKMYFQIDSRRRVRALRLLPADGVDVPVIIAGRPPEVACLRMLARVWDRRSAAIAERLAPTRWHFIVRKHPDRGWLLTLRMQGSETIHTLPVEGGILLPGTNDSAHSWGDVAYALVDLTLKAADGDDARVEAEEDARRLALRSLASAYTPS